MATVLPFDGSTLLRCGGFAVFENLPDPPTLTRLALEAGSCRPTAVAQESWEFDSEERRGGRPRRKLLTAGGGAEQDTLYEARGLSQFLSDLCGTPIAPSGNRGSYSYYARPGDFLDVHRDVETCDVAMITVLEDEAPSADRGGALVVYPGRVHEPVSAVRRRPNEGAVVTKVRPGQTVVMLGGLVPHWVLPVAQGQRRTVSVLCFRSVLPM